MGMVIPPIAAMESLMSGVRNAEVGQGSEDTCIDPKAHCGWAKTSSPVAIARNLACQALVGRGDIFRFGSKHLEIG